MNSRQRKKKLKKSLFHDYETKGKKIYTYAVACGNNITIGFTAKPKQKDVVRFHKNTFLKKFVYMVTSQHTILTYFSKY